MEKMEGASGLHVPLKYVEVKPSRDDSSVESDLTDPNSGFGLSSFNCIPICFCGEELKSLEEISRVVAGSTTDSRKYKEKTPHTSRFFS